MALAPPTSGVTPPKKKKKPWELQGVSQTIDPNKLGIMPPDKGVYSSVFPRAGKPAYPTKAASWSAASAKASLAANSCPITKSRSISTLAN